MFLDAIGKACPMPVIMAKKELDNGCAELTIAVDNKTAVENLTRLAESQNGSASMEEKDGNFHVTIKVDPASAPAKAAEQKNSYAVFIGKDHLGEGEGELGYNLLKMALYTLSQEEENNPDYVLFMNSGVKLPAGEEQQIIDSLKAMMDKGTEVLVCGTCLSFYGLTDALKIGTVSNMYEILGRMHRSAKVITL